MPGGPRESKTSPRRVRAALRRAEALKMRLDGKRYDDIVLALGYASRAAAVIDVQRALVATVSEPAEEVREMELQRLDELWRTVVEVLRRHHVMVNNGRIIYQGDEPLQDDGPVLAAVDRLLRIQERRAKYLGLDAPKAFEVVTLDAVDQQIRSLTEELARAEEARAAEPDGDEALETSGAETAPG